MLVKAAAAAAGRGSGGVVTITGNCTLAAGTSCLNVWHGSHRLYPVFVQQIGAGPASAVDSRCLVFMKGLGLLAAAHGGAASAVQELSADSGLGQCRTSGKWLHKVQFCAELLP